MVHHKKILENVSSGCLPVFNCLAWSHHPLLKLGLLHLMLMLTHMNSIDVY